MKKVTIHKAKTNLSQLIAEAEQGEEIVIQRGDLEVVRLIPVVSGTPKRQFGRWPVA